MEPAFEEDFSTGEEDAAEEGVGQAVSEGEVAGRAARATRAKLEKEFELLGAVAEERRGERVPWWRAGAEWEAADEEPREAKGARRQRLKGTKRAKGHF